MASINIKKLKASDNVAGLIMHNDKQERLIHNHANVDIDKTKTEKNFAITEENYSEKVQKLKKRLSDLDSTTNTNKRKDRIIALAINVPSPEGLEQDRNKLNHFFEDSLRILCNGKMENVISADVHYDEIHDYIDPQTQEKKSSKPHMHVVMIPEVDGKLNAKYWTGGKKVLSSWQKKIDDLARTYGAKFLTGEKKNHHKTVEQLKNESDIAEKNKLISEQNKKIAEQKIQKTELDNQIQSLKNEIEKLPDEKKIKSKLEAKKQADEDLKQFNKSQTGFYYESDPINAYGKKSITGKKITLPVEVVNQLQATNDVVSDALYQRNCARDEAKKLKSDNKLLRSENARLKAKNSQYESSLDDRWDEIKQLKTEKRDFEWKNKSLQYQNKILAKFKRVALDLITELSKFFNPISRKNIASVLAKGLESPHDMAIDAMDHWNEWNDTTAHIMAQISPEWCNENGVPTSSGEAKQKHDEENARYEALRQQWLKEDRPDEDQDESGPVMKM